MLTTVQRQRRKYMPLKKVPEEESPTEYSESESMVYAIIKHSDEDQDPKEQFLVEHQGETQLEIQDVNLEAAMPQDTPNDNKLKHTQDA
ncbi:hypothetical protein O181_006901 [Austropuccinia psidii MF-1]|uniref:Uncharacterized protein n=1 Tax=Austropuccinia psidii MF-1 TaxID=1389203 RepID=A0A9Q3GH58_9BASI|nr:hypothetical protein [Austropuccinia psidii MF-1]